MKIDYIGKCLLVEEEVEGKRERIVVIGDLHLGYEEALNKTGVFVSRKMFEEVLVELERVFEKVGKVDKVILLGDVKHDFGRPGNQEWGDALELFEYLKKRGEVIVVRGNHDNYLKNIGKKAGVGVYDFFIAGKIVFFHGDKNLKELWDSETKYWILGHVHPAIELSDSVKKERYKCFLKGMFRGKNVIVMPSFSEYSEGVDVREVGRLFQWPFDLKRFDVKVVGEKLEVLDFGKLRGLK